MTLPRARQIFSHSLTGNADCTFKFYHEALHRPLCLEKRKSLLSPNIILSRPSPQNPWVAPMNQVLHINTTDLFFTLPDSGAAFSLLFRGTVHTYKWTRHSLHVVLILEWYHQVPVSSLTEFRVKEEAWCCHLTGWLPLLLNSTANGSADGPTPIFHAGRLEIGDHQLYREAESREDNGVIVRTWTALASRDGSVASISSRARLRCLVT